MEEESNSKVKKIYSLLVKLLILVIIVTGFIIINKYFKISLYINNFLIRILDWINGFGLWAPVVYICIYIISAVSFISGAVLTLGAGFLFGIIKGSVYTSIGSTLGAAASFLIGRYFARRWVEKKIEKNPRFTAVDNAVAKEGWKIVGLTRLSPLFPYVFLNYAYGLTKINFWAYIIPTWICMIPGTIMYVYIGSLTKDLATLGVNQKGLKDWIFLGVGFIATAAVTLYVTYIAKKALSKRIE